MKKENKYFKSQVRSQCWVIPIRILDIEHNIAGKGCRAGNFTVGHQPL